MFRTAFVLCVVVAMASVSALVADPSARTNPNVPADARVFEMRKYYAMPGKLDALHQRFRHHTCKLFEKHGMTNIGYWTPSSGPEAENVLVYLLAYPSAEAKEAAWKAFRADPEWKKVREESEKDGKLVEKVESTPLAPTDYSPIR